MIFRRSESTDPPAATTLEVPPGELSLAEKIRRAPKALLHDHLDGGLRPQTVIEIADQVGYAALPAADAQSLGAWFRESADSGSLVRYLETFDHTLAVMQTADGLRRVAREAVLDLAEDGVVYAESRYAPEQHLEAGLQLEDVVEAVNAGFREGEGLAAEAGHPIRVTALLTAMRHAAKSTEIAELAVRYRDEGVAGFDIAGAEAGFPPTRTSTPSSTSGARTPTSPSTPARRSGSRASGRPSSGAAPTGSARGADRRRHHRAGPRVRRRRRGGDCRRSLRGAPRPPRGIRARHAHPLEMCPSSNVQTGAADSVALHPISLLKRLRFRVTVNTDNRLMSGTSMSREMGLLVGEAGWTLEDLRWVTINAMKSAFIPFDERLAIIDEVVKPGYAEILA